MTEDGGKKHVTDGTFNPDPPSVRNYQQHHHRLVFYYDVVK